MATSQSLANPADQPPASETPNNRADRWPQFLHELSQREGEISPLLPATLPWARFKSTAIAAVRANPEILDAEPRSLLNAIVKAGADGLAPDGREGVITVYNVKVKRRKPGTNATYEDHEKRAQWNPMVHGLRKRARELGDVLVDAQVVYENDKFVWRQGDEPTLIHEPAALSTSRGAKIGAYAIFRDQHGMILHREVMSKDQIIATRNQSKAKDSLMWTVFEEEGWRKAVIRRGIKSVPTVSEKFDALVRRDDENFDFGDRTKGVTSNGQAAAVSSEGRPALAGPPKAPAPPGNGGNGHAQPGPNGAGQPAAPQSDVEEATVVTDGAQSQGSGPAVSGQTGGGGQGARSARPRPPGVGADGRVNDYGPFAAWVKDTLSVAADASGIYDLWEQHIEPWRERIDPEWFKALRLIPKEIIASWPEAS